MQLATVIAAASSLFSLFLSHLPVFMNISVSLCLLDSYVNNANLSPFRPPVHSIHVKIRRTHTCYKVQVKVLCGRVRSVPSTAVPNATRLIEAGSSPVPDASFHLLNSRAVLLTDDQKPRPRDDTKNVSGTILLPISSVHFL